MSKSNKSTDRDFSMFDNMNTGELEDILRSDFQLPSDENSDMGAILYITEVIAKREKENPTGKFTDVQTAWASFNENYLPYIDDDQSLYNFDDNNTDYGIESTPFATARNKNFTRRNRGLIRVACVAAVITSILFVGTLTAYALGYDLWGAVAQWSRETFGFTAVTPAEDTVAEDAYSGLQEALDDYGIVEALAPTWIPEGYSLESVDVAETPTRITFLATYSSEDDEILITITSLTEPSTSTYEKDDKEVTVYQTYGIEHYIMTNLGRTDVVWKRENYECSTTGSFSIETAEKMIDSIYERK